MDLRTYTGIHRSPLSSLPDLPSSLKIILCSNIIMLQGRQEGVGIKLIRSMNNYSKLGNHMHEFEYNVLHEYCLSFTR